MRKQIYFILCLLYFALPLNAETNEALKHHVYNVLPTLEGWCTKEKASHFIDLVLEVKPEVYVEIGVFGGSSLFPVASALKSLGKGMIYAIDPWDKLECIKYYDPIEDSADLQWWGKINLVYVYYSYINMLRKHGLEDYCKTIKTTSEKAVSHIDSIDILYLDGNHSEVCSLQDVSLYLPKVRQGGYIWMNDSLWPTRQKAVEQLSEACDVVKLIDNGNCILFKKR